MSASSAFGAGPRPDVVRPVPTGTPHQPPPIIQPGPVSSLHGRSEYTSVQLGNTTRLSMMMAPRSRGPFAEQARELLASMETLANSQSQPLRPTSQTVFLQDGRHQAELERLLDAHYGADLPATNFVLQPPCCGAALAIEAWAVGGEQTMRRIGRHAVVLDCGSSRWIHCAGIQPDKGSGTLYAQTTSALEKMRAVLAEGGFDCSQVLRTWFYLGSITGPEADSERYKELNRARTDFYRDIGFFESLLKTGAPRGVYPASTGIGMAGTGLVVACTGFQSSSGEAFVLPLENPRQTPAYAYHPRYSPQSPKFSRALALVTPSYAATWISGTASIVNSESRHVGDIEKQTSQTIDNIERLIAPENFAARGVEGAGATLHDLAKVRVYIKRPEDYRKCRAVCEKRFGLLPAIYAIADVCRPELLVEIEGIAFTRREADKNLLAPNAPESCRPGRTKRSARAPGI